MATLIKKLQREQEKLRQKLGKAEETQDDEYDTYVANLNKQQAQSQRLLKEAQNFQRALKAMTTASKAFGDAIRGVCDEDWDRTESCFVCLEQLDLLHNDLSRNFQDLVVEPLTGYVQKFPEIKARTAKRDRKVLDYDRCKRNVDSAREKGSSKLSQAEKEFAEAEKMFSEINDECHQLLPSFYEGRVAFYGSVLQSYFSSKLNFDQGCAKTSETLRNYMDAMVEHAADVQQTGDPPALQGTYVTDTEIRAASKAHKQRQETESAAAAAPAAAVSVQSTPEASAPIADEPSPASSPAEAAPIAEPAAPAADEGEKGSDVIEVLIATHPYVGQDEDELTFNKGDIIHVIPFANEEDEDDGWSNGRLVRDGSEGVFPRNFTKVSS